MDFFNKFFDAKPNNKNKNKDDYMYMDMLSGEIPIYSQDGRNIYTSDVVQQAITCIATEMTKITPSHEINDVPVNDEILDILAVKPNPLMTACDLYEKTTWQLFLNQNSFIYPMFDKNDKLKGLYPLNPDEVTFLNSDNGKIFIKFHFRNNTETILPYDCIIHERREFSINDLMGGDINGQPDNEAIKRTVDLNEVLLNGVRKTMKASFAVNGIIKYHSMMSEEEIKNRLDAFNTRLESNQSGFLPLDLEGEYTPIDKKLDFIDNNLLTFIDKKILRNFGVPLPILEGDYTTSQYSSFYKGKLVPLLNRKSQAFTKGIFTDRERRGHKHVIKFYIDALDCMTPSEINEYVKTAGASGALYENEKRKAYRLAPLPELVGVRTQSLNYVDVNIAKEYQLKTMQSIKYDDGGDE